MASAEIESAFHTLIKQLTQLAPILAPQIRPRGLDDGDLTAFCKTEKQKQELQQSITKYQTILVSQPDSNKCSVCETNTFDEFTTMWGMDFASKSYILKSLQVFFDLF